MFPGRDYDAETGFHYNYFRTYDPSTGRYLESDPIGLLGGQNTFRYVDNDPISSVDEFGLQTRPPRVNNPYSNNPIGRRGGNRVGVAPASAYRSVNYPNSPVRAPSNAALRIAQSAIVAARSRQRNRENDVARAVEAIEMNNEMVAFMERDRQLSRVFRERDIPRSEDTLFRWWDKLVTEAEACFHPDTVEKARLIPEMRPWSR